MIEGATAILIRIMLTETIWSCDSCSNHNIYQTETF